MEKRVLIEQTPLSIFVRDRLAELDIRQSEFCRLTGFDQGLLSKILSSMVTNLSLESILKLSLGLGVPPRQVISLVGRMDLHELVLRSYGHDMPDQLQIDSIEMPPPVIEVSRLAYRVYQMGRSLSPVLRILTSLLLLPREHMHRASTGKYI